MVSEVLLDMTVHHCLESVPFTCSTPLLLPSWKCQLFSDPRDPCAFHAIMLSLPAGDGAVDEYAEFQP